MKMAKTGYGMGVLAALGLFTSVAIGEITFEIIGPGAVTDMSSDGTVMAGNTDPDYETFIWTAENGLVPLGRATYPVLGVAAGTPDVSDDGKAVSAMILGADSTYATQGLWTEDTGWVETMPPTPPDGGIMDQAYGSAWGLSGDGETLVGLYWRPGQPDGLAHASRWTAATGVVDLGSEFHNSRANDANYDGSVIVGWDEATWGGWRPTVWVDGVRTTLSQGDGFAEATCVTPDGTIIAGNAWENPVTEYSIAELAVWRWNGSVWEEELLGALPGTAPPFGLAIANDITADGSMIVGYNRGSSPNDDTGFIWTEENGLVDVVQYLVDNGIVVDPLFNILSLTAVSDDGSVMAGLGVYQGSPALSSFIISVTPNCPGDLDGDLDIDLADLAQLLSNYGTTEGATYEDGDLDGDGDVDLSDLAALLSAYGTTC